MNAEQQACLDLRAVKEFRIELNKGRPIYARELGITATDGQVEAERERLAYVRRQGAIVTSLATYEPLYRTRLELTRPGDGIRIFFSPAGAQFEPVSADEGDDVLVSWAHPRFLSIRDLKLGQSAHIGPVLWKLLSKTELTREHSGVLFDLIVRGVDLPESRFAEVRFDGDQPRAYLTVELEAAVEPAIVEEELLPVVREVELREKPKLTLDTVVRRKDGKVVEIPFALDERQWLAMRSSASEGTIVLTGPPGTGKTTVALLRATALIHSIFEYDQRGKLLSNVPLVDLRKDRFRVVVVTEHLRHYLKDFLSSTELSLPEAQVVNLRGNFLETFVRHKTLTTWISGVRFRLSKARNRLSDTLIYIKALPSTLRLCFFHAVLNAKENAGDGCQDVVERVNTRVANELERITLERVLSDKERKLLREEEGKSEVDIDAFLKRHGKYEAFKERFDRGYEMLRRGLTELRGFLRPWLVTGESRALESVDSDEEQWLVPGGDDLLLARFVDDLQSLHAQPGLMNLFVREAWRELVRLVDPQQVLLRVVDDFRKTGDMQSLEDAGLSREEAMSALNEWQQTLEGVTDDDGDEDEDGEATIEELIGEEQQADSQRRRGAFTRTDFPLLAAMARVFLAIPPEAKGNPDRYERVGFRLPDEVSRYDHVIIDEGQDFTYAEIHLVRSLVEDVRKAVTVSGDPWQRMDWRSGFSSLETISVPDDRRFLITRNYRQTAELSGWVGHLSRALYGSAGYPVDSAHEHGPAPSIAVIPAIAESLKVAATSISDWCSSEQNPFIAVLLIGFETGMKTRITNSLSNALEPHSIHVERIEDGRMIERGRVSVADVPTVKGLEFDAVVVMLSKDACAELDNTSPQASVIRNMLYVACSRARRGLRVVFQAEVDVLKNNGVY